MEHSGNEESKIDSGLMVVAEGAKFLRIKASTVRAWILRRKIPYVKLGGRVLLRKSDLEALVEKSLVSAR